MTTQPPSGPCDIVGCDAPVEVQVELAGLVSVRPRRRDGDPVRLCAEHARTVVAEVQRAVAGVLEREDPNLNRSNRAMSSEDLGDAEE